MSSETRPTKRIPWSHTKARQLTKILCTIPWAWQINSVTNVSQLLACRNAPPIKSFSLSQITCNGMAISVIDFFFEKTENDPSLSKQESFSPKGKFWCFPWILDQKIRSWLEITSSITARWVNNLIDPGALRDTLTAREGYRMKGLLHFYKYRQNL